MVIVGVIIHCEFGLVVDVSRVFLSLLIPPFPHVKKQNLILQWIGWSHKSIEYRNLKERRWFINWRRTWGPFYAA